MDRENLSIEASVITVEGMVQRVGFRRFAQSLARKYKLTGYAQNNKDGTVKLFIQGSRESVRKVVDEIRNAPRPIEVDNVVTKKTKPVPSLKHFGIKSGPLAEEIQEGFGGMQSEFHDYRMEFRDYRGEFRGFTSRTDDNFKSLNDNFNDYRGEFREFAGRTDDNFKSTDTKYGEISIRLAEILEELRTENREALNQLKESTKALREAVEKSQNNNSAKS
ncbi:MAG: acylphosphatase [Nitrososphaerales archaeon]